VKEKKEVASYVSNATGKKKGKRSTQAARDRSKARPEKKEDERGLSGSKSTAGKGTKTLIGKKKKGSPSTPGGAHSNAIREKRKDVRPITPCPFERGEKRSKKTNNVRSEKKKKG